MTAGGDDNVFFFNMTGGLAVGVGGVFLPPEGELATKFERSLNNCASDLPVLLAQPTFSVDIEAAVKFEAA